MLHIWTTGDVLTVAGIGLQVVGAFVAVDGLIRTHDAYADKTIRAIVVERLQQTRAGLERGLDRLLRRPRRTTVGASENIGFGMSANARGVVSWGPLPDETAAAITELDRRVRDVHRRLDGLDVIVSEASEQSRRAVDALREDLTSQHQEAIQLVRRAAIEGLMREAVGLCLVIIGSVLQAWGAIA